MDTHGVKQEGTAAGSPPGTSPQLRFAKLKTVAWGFRQKMVEYGGGWSFAHKPALRITSKS